MASMDQDRRVGSLVSGLSPVAVLALAGLGVLAGLGLRSIVEPAPSAVATAAAAGTAQAAAGVGTVNLERLINGLTELKDRNDAVRARGTQMQADLEARKRERDALAKEIELMPNRTPQERRARGEKAIQLQLLTGALENELKAAQLRLDLENGAIIRDLYLKALSSIETFAKKEGFELIMLDDRSMSVPDVGTIREISLAMDNRRVLFRGDALDVTDRVLTAMENEYAATGKQ